MSKNLSALFLFVLLLNTAFASTAYAGLFGSTHKAQDFAALTVKLFAKTEDADNFMFSLGTKAEPAYAKGNKVMQKLTTELGSEETAKKAISKLLNSEFGKKALAEWASEDAVKYYVKMFEKYGTQRLERFSTVFSSSEIEPLMKNLETISTSPNLKGLSGLEDTLLSSNRENGPGLFNEVQVAADMKNSEYELLSLAEKIEGGEIDNVARKVSTGEIYANEIKSGNLNNDKKIWGQLDRLKNYVDSGKANKGRLISRQTVPENVRKYAQERWIEVIEGGI